MKLQKIKELVENNTNISIVTKNRKREIVYARSIYYKLCKEHTRESLSTIGKTVKRDHATVLHGIKVFNEQISVYEDAIEYYKVYEKINNIIRKENSTKLKDRNPGVYYRNKYANTLVELRKERSETFLIRAGYLYFDEFKGELKKERPNKRELLFNS